jgi:transcriptional regulator with XRE-family HTH domain
MSSLDCGASETAATQGAAIRMPTAHRPLQRLAEVRRLQGITRRTVARRLNIDVGEVKRLEDPTADMLLSTLYTMQTALEVPVAELLVETEEPLSAPVMRRAQMVRLMKTAAAILERTSQPPIRRMAQMLCEQLVEVMPELVDVSPWHAVGRRRTQNELGQAAHRRLSTDGYPELAE